MKYEKNLYSWHTCRENLVPINNNLSFQESIYLLHLIWNGLNH